MDMYIQNRFAEINNSSRCRLFKNLKKHYRMEPYLQCNIARVYSLLTAFTKIRLCSHKLYIERGRWIVPKVEYHKRMCTLCTINDIQDENHIIMMCSNYKVLRKRISEMLLLQTTSMEKFLQLMTITNKAELYRLIMIFIKLVLKDYRPSSSL